MPCIPLVRTLAHTFALALLVPGLAAQVTYFAASLDGAQEVPPNASTGGGYGVVRLEEPANTVRIFTDWFGLSGAPTAAHLHLAGVGANGPVIVPLGASGPAAFTGAGVLTPAEVAALKTAGTYINVHTAAFPGGEIRGQVVAATTTRFTGVLTGAQEVPPNASTATGIVTAFLHEPAQRLLYTVETSGLTNVTVAHVHAGPVGVPGPIVFGLDGLPGSYCGVSPRLTAAQIATLLADGMFVNVHTVAFPGGEIRAQLLRDQGSHFTAVLDGASEVPPNPSAGVGGASLVIDAQGIASVVVPFTGLSGPPVAAHIHLGAIGVNGPIVVPLNLSGGVYTATFTPTAANLTQLRGGMWYVNVHTAMFPGGEIRGQLLPAVLPTTFGPNCPGSSGVRPEIGATGFAALGGRVSIDLYGAAPTRPAFLVFGFDRDASAAGPLPLPFAAVGLAAPCWFLVDPVATRVLGTDARGCSRAIWSLPFAPGLRGLDVHAQWIVVDPPANAAGFVASNGLTLTVQ